MECAVSFISLVKFIIFGDLTFWLHDLEMIAQATMPRKFMTSRSWIYASAKVEMDTAMCVDHAI